MSDDLEIAVEREAGTSGRVTLRDIAAAVGVSVSTASRALSGGPGISSDMRLRIQSAAERLNYAGIMPMAGSLTVLSDLHLAETATGEFMQAVQRGMERRARELGLTLSMRLVGPSANIEADAETSGYLLLSMQHEELINSLHKRDIPAVIVNGREPLMRIDAVAPANRIGGYLSAQHLLDLGHTRILSIVHSPRPTILDRVAGSQQAIAEAGLSIDDDLVVEVDAMRTNLAYLAIKRRLESGKRDFTAVLCCNDACAFGAVAALTEAGLAVPRDVSVIGFDDIPTAALNSVPLTTIHVDAEDIGARSVNRLIERIKSQDHLVTYTETAVKLVKRTSTARASKLD